jgi:hypothetical protein
MPFRLNCQQSAFSLVSAILVKIAAPEMFYQRFLFSEDVEKGEPLWSSIIDLQKPFYFEEREATQSSNIYQSTRKKGGADLAYLSSQYLSDSSLSSVQSISAFSRIEEVQEHEEEDNHIALDLEMDEINKNPSMNGFVTAVNKLSELPEHNTRPDMPGWMTV